MHRISGAPRKSTDKPPMRYLSSLYLWYTQAMTTDALHKPANTRQRLLDLAEERILQKGFGATSIEELVAAAGITKSGFFYHFRDKAELAHAIMQRFMERDQRMLDGLFDRARALHDDPLHRFLIGLKLFEEVMSNLPDLHPGCLSASACYQEQLFDPETRRLYQDVMLGWRTRFHAMLDEIAKVRRPKVDVDLVALADMVCVLTDGAIILSRGLKEKDAIAKQIRNYRTFISLLFEA